MNYETLGGWSFSFVQSATFSGALAGSGACLLSTPMEVVKTRLQLQGELNQGKKIYDGFFHGVYTILRFEGLRGIYSGIAPAIYYQIVMNGSRFGSHHAMKKYCCSHYDQERPTYSQNVLASGLAGVFGAFVGSPFYLVKVRLQSAANKYLVVGHQHHYKSTCDGFKHVINQEGFKGLLRGAQGQIMRVGMGSAVQISTYEEIKNCIASRVFFKEHPKLLPCVAALCTSFPLVITMNPFDVMATRLYNQKVVNGKGVYYTGPFDCLWKTFKSEGLCGLYKGTFAHYMRLAPHTFATLVILDNYQCFISNYSCPFTCNR